MKQQEQAIISKVLSGETDHFGELVQRYSAGLYIHCFRLVQNSATAEDLTQESFLKAFQNLPKFSSKFAFSTWLYKIATNICLDHLRKKSEVNLEDWVLDLTPSKNSNPNQNLQNQEVQTAVAKLPPDLAATIKLFYWQHFSVAEISNLMDIKQSLVKVRLHRGRELLKKEIRI